MSLPANPRAVVTGAAGGLGRALCRELIRRGGRVIVSDIDMEAARAVARELGIADENVVACDVTDLASVEHLADESERLLGGIDLIVNNAGVAAGGRVGELPIADWKWCIDINLWGVVYGCHVFVPRLRRQGTGHVLNVASTAGLIASPMLGPYNVSKSAVVALSQTLYGELALDGIGVSVLCPTFFKTNIADRARTSGDPAMLDFARGLMERASIQADEVARIALDEVQKDRLYILPHRDGRMLWRIKRFFPAAFYRLTPRLMRRRARRAALGS